MAPIVPENDDNEAKETHSIRVRPRMWEEIEEIAKTKKHSVSRVVELLLTWALEAYREEERQQAATSRKR